MSEVSPDLNKTICVSVGCLSLGQSVATMLQMGRVVSAVSGLGGMRPAWSLNRCCSLNETSDINSG